ncbi:MAG: AAA family ATPase [Acidimicrobiia bacterium]|nr:AAA family ATPase [Acidimicrobiia bacterium]
MVGRDRELGAIERLLDRAAPAALTIEGPAGIGKSTLWQRTIDLAAERGWLTLACRGVEAEARLSYAGLGELLEPVFEETWAQLIEPHRRAIEAALLGTGDDGSVPQHAVSAGFLGALQILSARSPVLVAVDDAPWLDVPSARVLAYVCRRLRAAPVAVSLRTPRTGPAPLGLDHAFGEDVRTRIEFAPLSLGAIHHVLEERLHVELGRPALARVHDASGGNPLLALELACAIRDLGRPLASDDPLPVSGALSDVIAARVNALPVETQHVLLIASASVSPTVPTILAITGASSWEATGGPAGETAGVIELRDGTVRFSHPLLASVAYAGASPVVRRDVHRRLAEWTTHPELRAHHLARTVTGPDEGIAATLDKGALRAWSRGSPAVAADMCRRARDATPPAEVAQRVRRTIDAATYLIEARELVLATELLDEVVASAVDAERVTRARLLLARVHQENGEIGTAFRVLQDAIADAPNHGATRLRLELDIAWTALFLGNVELGAAHGDAALARARREEDAFMVRSASAMVLFAKFMAGEGLRPDLLDAATAQPERAPQPLEPASAMAVAVALSLADELEPARRIFIEEGLAAEDRGSEMDLGFLLANHADLEWRDGHLDQAIEYANRTIELADLGDKRVMRGIGMFPRARALACLGRVEEAHTAAEEGLQIGLEAGHPMCIAANTTVLGFLEWSTGDAAATHALLGAVGSAPSRKRPTRAGLHAVGP